VLVANLDVAAVVEPLDAAPDNGRIKWLLALAFRSGARPIVVLTKADLVRRPDVVAAEFAAAAPDVPVHLVSARTGDGMAGLRRHVEQGRTLGLLGGSGVGKSSLVDALAGATVMTTQALRADGRGRRPSTFRALMPLPGGGVVIDTPGLRRVDPIGGDEDLGGECADVASTSPHDRLSRGAS
jgi:ribosome biogenesis GTPase